MVGEGKRMGKRPSRGIYVEGESGFVVINCELIILWFLRDPDVEAPGWHDPRLGLEHPCIFCTSISISISQQHKHPHIAPATTNPDEIPN